jgi:hypothetical protein
LVCVCVKMYDLANNTQQVIFLTNIIAYWVGSKFLSTLPLISKPCQQTENYHTFKQREALKTIKKQVGFFLILPVIAVITPALTIWTVNHNSDDKSLFSR